MSPQHLLALAALVLSLGGCEIVTRVDTTLIDSGVSAASETGTDGTPSTGDASGPVDESAGAAAGDPSADAGAE